MIRNHNLLSGVASAVGPFSRGRLWAAHGAYGGFSLASLFAASEQGVWYDPSDLTSMYQDSAGTTAAAVGSVVGLMLDKSKGLVRGPELVTNGGFDTNVAGWTESTGTVAAAWDSGRISVTNSGAGWVHQALTVTPNTSYEFKYNFITRGGTGGRLFVGNSIGNNAYVSLANAGAGSVIITPTASTIYISLGDAGGGSSTSVYDDFTLKAIPGNHATQATTASKPILARHPVGGRRNLLTYTEDFGNAVWAKSGDTVIAQTGLPDPLGGNRAARITGSTSALNVTGAKSNGQIASIYARVPTGSGSKTTALLGYFSLTKYQVTLTEEWQRFDAITDTAETGGTIFYGVDFRYGTATEVEIFAPQLETGSTATAYQKVVSQYNVTEAGKADLWYLAFDGFDDGMATGSINFTSTDEMTVIAGVRKLSDAAGYPVIAELSATSNSNNGSFSLFSNEAGSSGIYRFSSRGTSIVSASSSAMAAPETSVLSGIAKISTDLAVLRIDGTVEATNAADQGTGNFGTYPLYIGRRGGSSLPLNGNIYGLVVRGKLTAGDTLTKSETAMNAKTGAY